MRTDSLPAVNCSIVLRELPIVERLRIVADAGYDAVEFWWPFATATPSDAEVDEFAAAVERSRLSMIGLNLFDGDMPAGDRGILSWPGREEELHASALVAVGLSQRLGVRRFNALYGNRIEGVLSGVQDAVAAANLRRLAPLFTAVDGVLMIEPVSGMDAYPIKTADDAASVVARAHADGAGNVGVLLDLYHLAANGDDVAAAIARYGADAAHVQLADAPGRGAPGTAKLPLADWVAQLRAVGYEGRTALEYTQPADAELPVATTWKDLA